MINFKNFYLSESLIHTGLPSPYPWMSVYGAWFNPVTQDYLEVPNGKHHDEIAEEYLELYHQITVKSRKGKDARHLRAMDIYEEMYDIGFVRVINPFYGSHNEMDFESNSRKSVSRCLDFYLSILPSMVTKFVVSSDYKQRDTYTIPNELETLFRDLK